METLHRRVQALEARVLAGAAGVVANAPGTLDLLREAHGLTHGHALEEGEVGELEGGLDPGGLGEQIRGAREGQDGGAVDGVVREEGVGRDGQGAGGLHRPGGGGFRQRQTKSTL